MIRIKKFNFDNKELHATAMVIRTEVFVKEQNVPEVLEYENEEECMHFLIFQRRKAIGTARYRITERGIKFERFALLSEFRGKGYGRDILRYMLTDVHGINKNIYLNAQVTVVDFYKRAGFVIDGKKFMEAGIEHYPMEYIPQNKLDKALEKAVCRK